MNACPVFDMEWRTRPRSPDWKISTPARRGRCSARRLRLGVYAAQAERPDGANPATLAAADEYAAAFGLAFQMTDDLLDVESTADKAGKRVGKDAARGKLTYPGLLGVEESRRKAAELGQQAVAAADRLGSRLLAELARYRGSEGSLGEPDRDVAERHLRPRHEGKTMSKLLPQITVAGRPAARSRTSSCRRSRRRCATNWSAC